MALVVLNWVLPLERFACHFAELLGDEALGRRCLLAQMTPSTPAHMIDFHAYVLAAARDAQEGSELIALADALAAEIGYLQVQGMNPTLLERPREARRLLERLASQREGEDIQGEIAAMLDAQRTSRAQRAALYASAMLAAARDPRLYARTEAIVIVCRVAAEEEERRKVLQQRALRSFREAAERAGVDPLRLTIEDLLGAATVGARTSDGR